MSGARDEGCAPGRVGERLNEQQKLSENFGITTWKPQKQAHVKMAKLYSFYPILCLAIAFTFSSENYFLL